MLDIVTELVATCEAFNLLMLYLEPKWLWKRGKHLKNQWKLFVGLGSILLMSTGCRSGVFQDRAFGKNVALAAGPEVRSSTAAKLVRSDYAANEVTNLCNQSIAKTKTALDAVGALPKEQRTIANTLLAFEKINADFTDEVMPLTFMGYVSTKKDIAAEGAKCEEAVGQFNVGTYSRRDLYDAIREQKPQNAGEARLLKKTLESFEQSGLNLPDDQLAKVKDLKMKLSTKESQFSTNLNADVSAALFTTGELKGVPMDYVKSLKRDPKTGKYVVPAKSTDYLMISENASSAAVRKKMHLVYFNRAVDKNVKLLEEAIELRRQIAHLMGFKTWADYRIKGRMAVDTPTVTQFLEGLKGRLSRRNQEDFAQLLKYKKEFEPKATGVNQWDVNYLTYQLKKRDYNLDNEKIKEYFPADVVIAGLFGIYSKMLGVQFVEVKDAKVWHPTVKLFEIHDGSDHRLIGYFYADFYPREGKYGHAAAFPLISGRILDDGTYSLPVASIVANFSPPQGGKPALLLHEEVETFFHEFGHIMHQTLTRAPYASLSGASVAQDFVEAPSQMLENWVWSAQTLSALSGHYLNHSQKLPPDLLQKMLDAQDFGQGLFYTRQLLYGTFDMTLHTKDAPGAVDTTEVFDRLYRELMGQEPLVGGHFAASFGHLMGGYDAGYYGYLWSKVYAEDMFTVFPQSDLASPEVGGRYRKVILEQGNMKEAMDLLREFLGREPNSEAFFKKLHI